MGDHRLRLTLLLSGLRWRAGSTLALLAVSVVAVGVGAFGPVYLHSANQSILDATLAGAPSGADGLTLQPADETARPGQLAAVEREVPRAAGRPLFGAAIATEEVGVTAVAAGQPYASGLVARTGVCPHLHVVAGRCPAAAGQVIMSSRSAQALDVAPGRTLDVTLSGSSRTASLLVAGLYAPDNPEAAFWWGTNYFGFGTGSPARPELDDIFTSSATIAHDAPARLVSSMLQLPLMRGSLSVDAVSSLQSNLAGLTRVALAHHGVVVSTQLPELFSAAGATEHVSTSVIAVIDLELFLLAAVVLYFVASRTAAERAPDVRLAILRGFPRRSTLAVALGGPILVVAAATPVGLVVAWLAGWASARALFGAGVGASMTLLSVAAAVVGGVVGMGTVALGSRRVIAESEIDASRPPSQRSRTLRVVGDTVVVAVGAAAFAELTLAGVQGGSATTGADPLSVLAPGLLAAALGVLGARLLPRLLRARFRATARSASVAWTLATRRVARGAEAAPQVVLLALATGLAVFAVSGWSVDARNRTVQETFAVGAAKVLTVSVRPGVNFLSAVRTADPSGRSAMAAVVETAPDGTTLAVDASRMNAVMSWPPGLGAGGVKQVARRLVPRGLAPAVEVSGSAIRVAASATVDAQPAPDLFVDLFDNGYLAPEQVALGPVVPGAATYQGSLQGLCPSTCRLVDLSVSWAPSTPGQTGTVDLDVTTLTELTGSGWEPVDAGLGQPKRWTATPGQAQLVPSRSGLAAGISLNPSGSPVVLAPNCVPSELPAVVTPTVASLDSGFSQTLSLPGLDGGTVTGRSVGDVPALPGVGSVAALVDLGTAETLLSGPFSGATTQVWLSAGAPSDMATVLADHGVAVTGVDSPSARQRASAHEGVQLAYTLFLVAAWAAGMLALAATGFAVIVGARRRRAELTDMRSLGFEVSALRRSLQAEQALCVGAGVFLGVVAGVVAAAVALRSVPESVTSSPGPPLELGLPALLLAASVGALVVALWLTVWVGSSLLIGAASAENIGGGRQ